MMRYFAIVILSYVALASAKKEGGMDMMMGAATKSQTPSPANRGTVTNNNNDSASSNNNNANNSNAPDSASAIDKTSSICFPYRSQDRPTLGVCFAYCDRQQCHTQTTPSQSCLTLLGQFTRKTGLSQLPCDPQVESLSDAPNSMPTLAIPTAINEVSSSIADGVSSIIATSVAWMDNMPTLAPTLGPTIAPSPVDA